MEQKILQKAKKLFLDFGFKSVTMDDIASKLGISKKTIYKYFSNKTDLVESCVFQMFDEIMTGVSEVCDLKKNPIDELYSIEEFVVGYLNEKDHTQKHQLKKFYPELHDMLEKKWFESLKVCIESNLVRGIEQGFFRKDIDVNFITGIYFSGLVGVCDINVFPDVESHKSVLVFKFLEYHIRAISTKKGINKLETILDK